MTIQKPYRRNVRQFVDGNYAEGGRARYISHAKFAVAPEHYVRAFLLIQKDLLTLFEYVEPADTNLQTFSFRIHELLLRTCIEIEANFVAILTENGYKKSGKLSMSDYQKVNKSHLLSDYEVNFPFWHGAKLMRRPFSTWENESGLKWYQAYNKLKHERHLKFQLANFDNLLEAVSALVILLSSQFRTEDFGPGNGSLILGGSNDDTESAIGDYFRVKFPTNWPKDLRYDFNWQELQNEHDPFQNFNYK